MRRLILFLLALSLLPIFRMPASAQMSNMPEDLRARLAEINPTWGKDILGNVATTLALYTPLLAAAPKDGVSIERDLAYGPDALHRLDLHKQEGRTGMPIVVFLHGGAYVRGSRSVNTEVYGNVATYFARQGMLGVNGTYRLAPAAQWPAAAQDVGLLVKWLKANASAHGGDPERIYLIGHSAGATHIATYLYHTDLQEPNAAGIAGVVLSVIECFETDGGVNYRSDWLIFFNLCGFRLMLQATFLDGVPFDPFSFQQDSWATSEVDVGRR